MPCGACRGKGRYVDEDTKKTVVCRNCKGSGQSAGDSNRLADDLRETETR